QEQLLARQAIPDWQSLDTLADAITSVEYYLERLSEDCGSQGDLILDVAEESLQNLGYRLQEAPSILDQADFGSAVEPEPEPEVEPELQAELAPQPEALPEELPVEP